LSAQFPTRHLLLYRNFKKDYGDTTTEGGLLHSARMRRGKGAQRSPHRFASSFDRLRTRPERSRRPSQSEAVGAKRLWEIGTPDGAIGSAYLGRFLISVMD